MQLLRNPLKIRVLNGTFPIEIWYHEAHVVVVFPQDLRFSGTSGILPSILRLLDCTADGTRTRPSSAHSARAHRAGRGIYQRTPVGLAKAAQSAGLEYRCGPGEDR